MQLDEVGFVFGGDSAESDVSVISMLILEKKIRGMGIFNPRYIYVSKEGKFYLIDSNDMKAENFKNGVIELNKKCIRIEMGGDVYKASAVFSKRLFTLSACVNCCHGGDGENGSLAGFFKTLCVPFSTASNLALGLSMDKHIFKTLLRGDNLPTVPWVSVSKCDWVSSNDSVLEKIQAIRFPVVVKPNDGGSSLGVTVARNVDELKQSISVAFEFSSLIIVEKMIENVIEFNCAVLGGSKRVVVSDVDEIIRDGEVFSFKDKYIGDAKNSPSKKSCKGMEQAQRNLPANIPEKLKNQIQELSAKVFKLLGLSGVSRVDFLYDKKRKKLYIGEVNAVPGSLALYFFKSTKIGELGVIKTLVDIAKEEYKNKTKIKDDFIPKIF